MSYRSVAYHLLPGLPAYDHAQSPVIFACWLSPKPIIPHTALLNGLHFFDLHRCLAHATSDEFPAHYDVPRNATLHIVPSRPIQIHAVVMPIFLLPPVARRSQPFHIHCCSSDGFLIVSVLPLLMFSPCGSCHTCSAFVYCSGDNFAVCTPALLLGLLPVVVGFAPLMLSQLQYFLLSSLHSFPASFASVVFFNVLKILNAHGFEEV